MRRSCVHCTSAFLAFTCNAIFARGQTPVTTALTYQGQVKVTTGPLPATVNLDFRLFNAVSGGGQIGIPELENATPLDANGLFTVTLNDPTDPDGNNVAFTANAFNGDARWLEIRVNGQLLTPRQPVTAAPYSHFSLKPWATIGANISNTNTGGVGIGTATPAAELHVRPLDGDLLGEIRLTPGAANGNAQLVLAETTSATDGMVVRMDGTAEALHFRSLDAGVEAAKAALAVAQGSTGAVTVGTELRMSSNDASVETLEILADEGDGGARLTVRGPGSGNTVRIDGHNGTEGGGSMVITGPTGNTAIVADSFETPDGGALMTLRNDAGTNRIILDANSGGDGGAALSLVGPATNNATIVADGHDSADEGALMSLRNGAGTARIILDAVHAAGEGGRISLRNAANATTIDIDAEYGGVGGTSRIIADTLNATGGGFVFPDGTTQTTASTSGAGFWSSSGMSIYSNNTGNVGIGTNAPTSKLHVVGDLALGSTVSIEDGFFQISPPSNQGGKITLRDSVGFDTVATLGDGGSTEGVYGHLILNDGSGVSHLHLHGGGSFGASKLSMHAANGTNETVELLADEGDDASRLILRGPTGHEAFLLDSWGAGGAGELTLFAANGTTPAVNINGAGDLALFAANGTTQTVNIQATEGAEGGQIILRNSANSRTVELDGDVTTDRARLTLYAPDGANGSIRLDANGTNNGGEVSMMYPGTNMETIDLISNDHPDTLDEGGRIRVRSVNGLTGVAIKASEGNDGGQIQLFKSNGGASITLDAEYGGVGGHGRVITDVLEVTGADVAERFPVSDQPKPGEVVEIDPDNPGMLRVARGTYNRRVAGVVSGAGNIPVGTLLGNLPGHKDAPAIALSGRVYVLCDASNGAIEPGDTLTTSETPGHAMKVADYPRAQGSIIGKAMTKLESGRDLVLVLVSLQ